MPGKAAGGSPAPTTSANSPRPSSATTASIACCPAGETRIRRCEAACARQTRPLPPCSTPTRRRGRSRSCRSSSGSTSITPGSQPHRHSPSRPRRLRWSASSARRRRPTASQWRNSPTWSTPDRASSTPLRSPHGDSSGPMASFSTASATRRRAAQAQTPTRRPAPPSTRSAAVMVSATRCWSPKSHRHGSRRVLGTPWCP